jgi:hypothetical protein
MLIDPKVNKLVIFNGGGGIVEREIKLSVSPGSNEFEIQNVPASFDPNSAKINLEYINPTDRDVITLQQTIVSLPDPKNVQQLIDREKGAATNIISYSIDFTRELREQVSNICEASSYRTYSDMKGTFNFIINSKKEGEVIVKITYFVSDIRLKWETNLQVNLSDDGKIAELEANLIVDNQTGFHYDNVELGFAIFELPGAPPVTGTRTEDYYPAEEAEMQQAAWKALPKQKRTQRMKNLML